MSGFSLIEVLVTVVVLAIGLLSLAALQLATLKNNTSALTRFEATTLAYDILDRMRANHGPAVRGDYDIAAGESPGSASDEIASQDLVDWKTALANDLPNGDGAVTVNGRTASVTVQWAEVWDENLGADPDRRLMSLQFRTEL